MANALIEVQATFLSLDSQLNTLLAAITTQEQKAVLLAKYSTAQQNYVAAAQYAALSDDDAQVAALSTQLKAANAKIVQATALMDNFDKLIHDITTAVSIGEHLVAMAGPGPGH
jgi:hypothetical protein